MTTDPSTWGDGNQCEDGPIRRKVDEGDRWDRIEALTDIPAPYGAIQWKGTSVCMDIHCTCGAHLHADLEFLYYVRCGKCRTLYAVSAYVKLIPLLPSETPEPQDEEDDGRFHTLDEDW